MTPNELQTAVEELEALVNTGSDYEQAETQARLILVDAGIENEPELHCKVLLALSDSLWRRGLAQDAMPYSELASSIAQDNKLKHFEARALGNTGVQFSILTDYAHALEYLHKALEIDEEQGNKQGMSRHTNNIGKVHNALSDYNRALEYYKQSLLLAEEIENENLIESAFSDIANAYLHLSDYPKALEYFNKELSRCDKIRRKDKLQAIKANIGIVHHLLSNYQISLEYLRESLSNAIEIDDKNGMIVCYINIAINHSCLSEPELAIEAYNRAIVLAEELDNLNALSASYCNIGAEYNSIADYGTALGYLFKSIELGERIQNLQRIADSTFNVGMTFRYLSDDTKAIEYFKKALKIYKRISNKRGIATSIYSIGLIHHNRQEYTDAIDCYQEALTINKEIGNLYGMMINISGIGIVQKIQRNFSSALEHCREALSIAKNIGDKKEYARNLYHIALLLYQKDFEYHDDKTGEEYHLEAIEILNSINNKYELYHVHKSLSELYSKQGRISDELYHFRKYHELEKEVQNEEAKKKAEQLDYERKTAEREKQLAVERAEAATVKRILHNTLPPIIADRLINNETFIADSYPNVSVLFMDLVNFTRIAAIIPPRHLIYLLNTIFSNADAVMEKHGLEKIKTIGDAYMAVAGAPVHQEDHAQRAALAALDVMEAMNNLSVVIPEELGETSWTEHIGEIQVRIGLHCGEAIGGVIGDKKFTFDLWGDAVNTAARMESHGEAGKIHCSEEFVNQLTMDNGKWIMKQDAEKILLSIDNYQLSIIPRGEMEIKGKGIMRTYFLEEMSEP